MLEYSIRELTRRWKRSLITVSGYFAALSFLCLLLSTVSGAGKASGAILNSTGTHFIAYVPICEGGICPTEIIDAGHEGFYVGTIQTRLLQNSVLQSVKALPSVADAAPFLLFKMRDPKQGNVFTIGGLGPEASLATAKNSCAPGDIVEGSFLSNDDTQAVMIEAAYAASAHLKLGDTISIANSSFTVKGIVDPGIRPAKADVYMKLSEAETVIRPRIRGDFLDNSSLIMVESRSSHMHDQAMRDVKRVLGDEVLLSSYNCYKPAAKADTISKKGADLAALLVYICIIVYSLQSQLHSVSERKHEIGILASVGWSRTDIVVQITYESLLQAIAGWLGATFASAGAIALIGLFSPSQTISIMPEVYLISFVLALSSGAIAGLIPGLAAANRKPAECLRKY